MKDAIDKLAEAIEAQNEELQGLTSKVARLVPASELDHRLEQVENRLKIRSMLFLFLSVLVAAGTASLGYTSLARITTERAQSACHSRNQINTLIRDLVDRGQQSQNYDLEKMSPETKKILAEFAAAQRADEDPQSYRNYVYSKTTSQDCNKV